jgi:peroxiredoxin
MDTDLRLGISPMFHHLQSNIGPGIILFLLVSGCHSKSLAQNEKGLLSKPAVMAPAATIGQAAPDFRLTSTDGQLISLKQFLGKTVVIEWFNPDCPFVKVAHREGKLGSRAALHVENGGIWLGVNSGAAGRQGHGLERNKKARVQYKLAYPIVLDEDGQVGRLYGATRTPHIFVIDPKGILVYAGALDSTGGAGYGNGPMTDYLGDALKAIKAGTTLTSAKTKSWGCSVKYVN